MSPIVNLPHGQMTMTSREIAELTGKEHRNVLRDARTMLLELHGDGGLLSFEQTYRDPQNGQEYPILALPKRETLILVSGYSVTMRARIIDRWQELEAAQPSTSLPQTFAQALRLAAEQQEEIERQQVALQAAAPAVEFHAAVTEAINTQPIQEIAKVLGMGPKRMFQFLRDEGMLIAGNLPAQQHLDAGHFRVVERTYTDDRGDSRLYTRTLVTGRGLALIQRRIALARASPTRPGRPQKGEALTAPTAKASRSLT